MNGRIFSLLLTGTVMAALFFTAAFCITVAILVDQYGMDGPEIPDVPWACAVVAISPVLGFAYGAWVALKPIGRHCANCGKAVKAPKDRKCFWCGFDWRTGSALKIPDVPSTKTAGDAS